MAVKHNPYIRRRTAFLCAMGIVAVLGLAASLAPNAQAADAALKGMAGVSAPRVYLRRAAADNARVVATVVRGEVVKVLSSTGEWSNAMTSGGKQGWCRYRDLSFITDAGAFKPGNTAKLDWPSEFINMAHPFTYQRCQQDMDEIAAAYEGMARVETVGTSVMGNPIRAIVVGNPEAKDRILVQAAIHARENLTALLAMRQLECLLKAAKLDGVYKGVRVAKLLRTVEIWVVPHANPDGARLFFEGLSAVPASMPELKAQLKAMNGGRNDFTRWKANARGVDLNRNFNTGWKVDPLYRKPGPYNYAGPRPLSEPETVALRDLMLAHDFALTMSYHTSGEILFWYNPKGVQNDLNKLLAGNIAALNGYTVLAPSAQASNGGFRDWFAEEFSKPGITLEMGGGYSPLPQSNFSEYWKDNRFVLLELVWTAAPKSLVSSMR